MITARCDGANYGMTASAVSSLSLEPPQLLICVNRSNATHRAISASGPFAVNILDEAQAEVAATFASRVTDKFGAIGHGEGTLDLPVLPDALAVLECTLADKLIGGTHEVFVGQVRYARARGRRAADVLPRPARRAGLNCLPGHPRFDQILPRRHRQPASTLVATFVLESSGEPLGLIDHGLGWSRRQRIPDAVHFREALTQLLEQGVARDAADRQHERADAIEHDALAGPTSARRTTDCSIASTA